MLIRGGRLRHCRVSAVLEHPHIERLPRGNQPLVSSGSVAIALAIGRSFEQLRFIKRAAYVQANEHYWRSQAATRSRAPALANRWIAVPASRADALASSFGILSPPTFARCLVEDHGSLSIIAGSRLAGKPSLMLKDAGNAPGASPSSLIVGAEGPRYPLRLSSNGNTRPGGHIDVCNDGKGGYGRGSISFSQFGKVRPIRTPRDLLHLSGLARTARDLDSPPLPDSETLIATSATAASAALL